MVCQVVISATGNKNKNKIRGRVRWRDCFISHRANWDYKGMRADVGFLDLLQ